MQTVARIEIGRVQTAGSDAAHAERSKTARIDHKKPVAGSHAFAFGTIPTV